MLRWILTAFLLLGDFAQGSVAGVMATDEEELGGIVSFFEGPVKKYSRGMRTFYKGRLWGVETVIVLSNVGKAAAASAAVDLISEGVDWIVFLGTAGALDNRLNIGDVVLAEKMIEFDVDFRPLADLYGFPDGKRECYADFGLREAAEEAISGFLAGLSLQGLEGPKMMTAAVGTADHFLLSEDEVSNLSAFAPDIVCIDMESAAVAQVAGNYALPFIAVRTVSNYIGTSSKWDFHEASDYDVFLTTVQPIYTKGILQALFSKIQKGKRNPIDGPGQEKGFAAGILCTTKNELQSLIGLLEGKVSTASRGGHDFYRGMIGSHQVVISSSGFGKSAASALAEELIANEKVRLLVAAGNAFSADENVKDGDIVISKSLIEHDVDVRPFRPQFQLPTIGATDLPADAKVVRLASKACSVHIGQIASGDTMLHAKELLVLKKKLPSVLCVDSESAPAAQAAYQSGIPFLAIKSISNQIQLGAGLDRKILRILPYLFDHLEEG